MMKCEIMLRDVITGIFTAINYPFEKLTNDQLDRLYLNFSGNKIISPMLERMLTSATIQAATDVFGMTYYRWTGTISPENISALGAIINGKFSDQWDRLYDAITSEYNPVNNYDMKETETESGTNTGTVTDAGNTSRTVISDVTDRQVYGFNSVDPVNADKTSSTGSESGTAGNTRTDDLEHTSQRLLTREGNIGVTTAAQMITGEIELRGKWNFYDQVFKDIDSILCCHVY